MYVGAAKVTVTRNHFASPSGGAGGIYAAGLYTKLNLYACTFKSNSALVRDDYGLHGEAIYARQATLFAHESAVCNNSASTRRTVYVAAHAVLILVRFRLWRLDGK